MKTILVPVDFSENSKNALDYAILLAEKLKMKILLLHVFNPGWAEAIADSYKLLVNRRITGTAEDNQKLLKLWLLAATDMDVHLECETKFLEGDLSENIESLSLNTPIEMIVMGTKGASGVKEVIMGSNTMKVIEKASCPVIAVPMGIQNEDIRKIVFATDYRIGDDVSIRFLGELAKRFGSELHVVHILDSHSRPGSEEVLSENFVKGLAKAIKYDKIKFHCIKGTDIQESLTKFTKVQKADLLAISFTDKSIITSLFKMGLTWKLAYHVKIPLIVFPLMEDNTVLKEGQSAF